MTQGVRYEYLDGAHAQSARRMWTRFQNDPDCGLFLISLKAGGLGLNLTAAEYVFLLDPWWNPAVEAQAVDRAHRIGQTRPVFAYRLIARDTVEEKVLELQKTKRDLADAILGEDNSLIRDLKREDLGTPALLSGTGLLAVGRASWPVVVFLNRSSAFGIPNDTWMK